MVLRMVTGGAFILAGALELLFFGLSVVGTLMGGAMTVGTLAGELRGAEAFIGPAILLFYGLWFLCTLVAGPTHLIAGTRLLMGYDDKKLLWAAVIVSVFPLATVYCAPTSMIAGILGLVLIILPKAQAAHANDQALPG